MKTKTQVKELEKEDKQESEEDKQKRALEISQQDQVNLNMNGYFRQQLLATLERIARALEGLRDFMESSESSAEKEELEVPRPSDE